MPPLRADDSALNPEAKAAALRRFGLHEDAWLAKGTEAEVYLLSEATVLKLYADPGRVAELSSLKSFYDSLDAASVTFGLPRIHEINPTEGLVAVVERRMGGAPLADVLPRLNLSATSHARSAYLDAVLELGKLRCSDAGEGCVRFDDAGEQARPGFTELVYHSARLKLDQHRPALALDVTDLNDKERLLDAACRAHVFEGPLSVIHGDFFPGNVLVTSSLDVAGVIDFASFPRFGDRLYDVALACIFYDMYGTDRATVRDELIALAIARLGTDVESTLYRYATIYAIMSCDRYAATGTLREDDHYRWAVDLLNDDHAWECLRR